MEIWTLAYDTDAGTGATVHMTEREAYLQLIAENVNESNRDEAIQRLDSDGEEGSDFWEWFDVECRGTMDTFSIDSHDIDVPTESGFITGLKPRELATVLHALRKMQDPCNCIRCCEHFEDCEQLSDEEVDDLCERLNCSTLAPEEEETNG